ncbi:MAG: hypothetical protein BWY78_01297 [Alphaproteobacteria bacterium ADurb.Bin438]|nr:MAG: hypothetical protein BWY78_01297 [Alphaproteobacteria bacterium ADurb.Bin438]
MPVRKLVKLPSLSTVAAGSIATCKVPTGNKSYRTFMLKAWNNGTLMTKEQMKTLLKRIAIKINGVVRFDMLATDAIDLLMTYKDRAFKDGKLLMPFSDDYARFAQQEDALSLNTLDIQTLDFEVEIADEAVNPKLELSAFEDLPYEINGSMVQYKLGAIREVRTFNHAISGAMEYEIADLPKSNGMLMALHFKPSVLGSIEKITIKADNLELTNIDLDLNRQMLSEIGSRKPLDDFEHIDFLILDRLQDAFNIKAVADFGIIIKTKEKTDLRMVVETLNVPQV